MGIATVRAGNVIGGGDWAEDRLIPDAVKALQGGKPVLVRNPNAVRPWQHVVEPLAGYLMLAERLYDDGGHWGGAWNFGPRDEDALNVGTLCDLIIQEWGEGQWVEADNKEAPHEAHFLKLDCSKARQRLRWQPCFTMEKAVSMTMSWYKKALGTGDKKELFDLSCDQIKTYMTSCLT